MAKITRFKEPLKFQPLDYRGLDQVPVFIEDGSADSYDYFGLTRVPTELTAGRNLISFTGTRNLVPGSEIAIEVLDSNGETIPIQTYDHIGEGNERIFAIEIGKEVPEGDALITLIGVAKGEVGFDAQRQRDASRLPPPRFRNVFNIRWQKRLNVYPRRRNTDEIIYFTNPDITVEEIKRPYFKLHYNPEITQSTQVGAIGENSRSLFTLNSIASEGEVNSVAQIRYEAVGDKYYIISEENPDFGGFTQDMVGGTLFVKSPNNPFPARFDSPVGTPSYNELETGDGTGTLDSASNPTAPSQYTNQGAFNTIISEVVSPLRLRVNSPHTTFQGFGRANQKEVFHRRFDESTFRIDFAQAPISRSNPLTSGSNTFATSYAKVTFNNLTPLVGDVTRIKTFIRNDQTVTDYFLIGDNPVEPQNLLIQSSSEVERHSAGDFSPFGVSSSLATYWSASTSPGLTPKFETEDLNVFRQLVGNVNNPIPDALQIGDSVLSHTVGQLDGTNYILVDSLVPILHNAGKYYQVEFKCFGQKVNTFTPSIKIYMYGSAINDEGDDLGQMIGHITDIDNQELITEEDPFNEYRTTSLKFTYRADATEFAYLRFKIEQGLFYIYDVEIKPYYQYGYTPHFFDAIIPTTKANVGEVDALDFRFEFYNDEHNKAVYTADLPNIEFDNEYTFTATNAFFTSASIGEFIGATPMGDNDWVKPFNIQGDEAQFAPNLTGSIYHSGSVGIGNFLSQDVNFPLHVNMLDNEGNATIKLESFSSSILHLASDVGGAGVPNQKNAFILFDHNNASTSSVIGYTDTKNIDPGGATFDGAPEGSFTIHERHGESLAIGVGGKTSIIIAQDGKASTSQRAVYVGYDDVKDGPFNPDQFGHELNVSGSFMVSSGAIHYPNPPGASATDSDIVFLSYDTPHPPFSNDRGKLVSRSFRDSAAVLGLGADFDWHIGGGFISQSRLGGGSSIGSTVVIGDGNFSGENAGYISPTTHILQISQSGTSPASKIRITGLNDLNGATNNVLVLDTNGDLYLTGSYGAGGVADNLGDHTATQDLNMGGFDILNVGEIVAVNITASFITSSTLVTTGSNVFGHQGDDSHEFIGSITASADISASGKVEALDYAIDGKTFIDYSSTNDRLTFGQSNQKFRVRGNSIELGDDGVTAVTASSTASIGYLEVTNDIVIGAGGLSTGVTLFASNNAGSMTCFGDITSTSGNIQGDQITGVNGVSSLTDVSANDDILVGDDVILSSANAKIQFTNVASVALPNGISYKDSGGSQRFSLIMDGVRNTVKLGNRAADGTVQIAANVAAGAAGESVVAEFSASNTRIKNNLTVDLEPMHSTTVHKFGAGIISFLGDSSMLSATNNSSVLVSEHGYENQFASNMIWYLGQPMPYSGSITSMTVRYNCSAMNIAKNFHIWVSCSVFRSGSTGGGPNEHFSNFQDVQSGDTESKGATLASQFNSFPPIPHGISGSHVPLITEKGPQLPNDVFGSNSPGVYNGVVNYRKTYPRDQIRFAPGDRMYVNPFRADEFGTPQSRNNSFNNGTVGAYLVSLEVIYDRSGSYGIHSGSSPGIGYDGNEGEDITSF